MMYPTAAAKASQVVLEDVFRDRTRGRVVSQMSQKAKKRVIEAALEADEWDAGKGLTRIDEIWRGRSGWPTHYKLLERAEELGLIRVRYEMASDRMRGDDEFYGEQVTGMHLVNGNRKA